MRSSGCVFALGFAVAVLLAGAAGLGAGFGVKAADIETPWAELTGLDKITGQTVTFVAAINETVQFGALLITPRICHRQEPTDPPHIKALVEVAEVTRERKVVPIFAGWMFADNPALSAVDHAVFDVWLNNCTTSLPDSRNAQ